MNEYDIWQLYFYAFNVLIRDKRKRQCLKICEMYQRKLKSTMIF